MGRFVTIYVLASDRGNGKPRRWHKQVRYAISIEHAKAKILADDPACEIGAVSCCTFEVARTKLTQRSGDLMAIIPPSDREELRNDLLAWEATREPIVLAPPQHPLTFEATTGTRTVENGLPEPKTSPVMTFEQLVEELNDEFEISKTQLIGVLRRNELPVADKKDEYGQRRFSELDVWAIRRFLRYKMPRFIRSDASEPVT
ncbi:hypothetical protein C5Y96_20035 [Blastopirellula marina]|uniref:Uncharacterized protein n=2 Tax=Pirellulales TaxID=2691354 RepID=A0A2S8F4B2_9BACT|nr:hypothetical protein C5Y96_20035 [Blastopirellula marina]RCS46253.1 hypothetical protein DTL36_20065 [Bremerella cremea]